MTLKLGMRYWLLRLPPNLFKWWPWIDLDLFYSTVKFGSFCFCMGKCLSCRLPRNYWSLWGEYRCTYSQINEYMMIYDNPSSSSFIDLCPRSLRSNILQLLFLKKKKPLGRLTPNFIPNLHGMLGWKCVQMFRVTWPRWRPDPYMVRPRKKMFL